MNARQKNGWHICEEVIVEIVDPATGKQLGPGELGEVVVTRLNNIFFLFRFGTGDLSKLYQRTLPMWQDFVASCRVYQEG